MPNANARYQQAYRDRLKETGAARVGVTLPKEVLDAVTSTAQRLGVTRQDAVIHLINQGSANVKHDQYRQDHSNPLRMTADEAADVKQFETQLLNDRLDAREEQINGGAEGKRAKDALNAMLDSSNQHRR